LPIKIFGAIAKLAGLSLRKIKHLLSLLGIEASHEAIRKWVKKLYSVLDGLDYERDVHREIAIDETKLKINGKHVFIWSAVDPRTKENLGIAVTKTRNAEDAYNFLRKVLKSCINMPTILVDHAPWYLPALNYLDLKYKQITFGSRNSIERFFRTMKETTKAFYNNFPYRNISVGIKEVEKFLELFVFWYNCIREHMSLNKTPMEARKVLS